MIKKYLIKFNLSINITICLFISLIFLFGRSFMGLYLLGFRLGELLVGFSLFVWILFLLNGVFKFVNLEIDNNLKNIFYLMPLIFFITLIVKNNILFNTYTFKSSSYIWTVSIFFAGVFVYQNFDLDKLFIYTLNPILIISYLFQVFAMPEEVSNFFLTMGDKFEPHKGSDLTILFVVAFMINSKYFRENRNFYAYVAIFAALYMPFLYFKSRASFIAVFLFLLIELIKYKKLIYKQLWLIKGTIVFVISILVFLQSVFWVRESGIIKVYEARENVISLVEYRTQTTIEDAPSLFWISDNRLYSSDGNLNWRMDIWQDIILDLNNEDSISFGYGYEGIIPVMEWYNGYRLGLDGLNEHVHNNWFNIFARGGLFQIAVFIVFYYFLINKYFEKHKNYKILIYLIPVMFVSFFDASMENAHFPLIYYFFLGRNFILGK